MKNIIYLLAALVSMLTVKAQNFQGVATYESKTIIEGLDKMKELDNKKVSPEMQQMIMDRVKKMFEKTFTLKFDRTASTYEEEERLDSPNDPMAMGFKMMGSMMGGGKYYKNVKARTMLQEKDIFGKEFLVSDSLPGIKWVLVNETKKIGNYTCYKATAEIPVDKSNMMNYRPKKGVEEEIKKKNEEEPKKTNFMEMVEMPDTKIITAWYTPEIPINQGPANYWGLPGLILEVSDDKTVLLCSKVVLNPKEKSEIKVPKKGEKVTQAEFAEIMAKKIQEMQDMYGGQGGGRMRIGG